MATEALPSVARRPAAGRLTAAVSGVGRWAVLLGLAAVVVIPILYAALGGVRDNYQLTVNPHRITSVLYRAPYSDRWEEKPLDWAMDRIAERLKETRDRDFVERAPDGTLVNHLTTVTHLGGATLDNEENYLIKKLWNGLGIVSIENQARI